MPEPSTTPTVIGTDRVALMRSARGAMVVDMGSPVNDAMVVSYPKRGSVLPARRNELG
ncbi:hypothetical protein D3C78_1956020 [compost metagenome]